MIMSQKYLCLSLNFSHLKTKHISEIAMKILIVMVLGLSNHQAHAQEGDERRGYYFSGQATSTNAPLHLLVERPDSKELKFSVLVSNPGGGKAILSVEYTKKCKLNV